MQDNLTEILEANDTDLFEVETLQEWNSVTNALAISAPAAVGGCNSCSNNDVKAQ